MNMKAISAEELDSRTLPVDGEAEYRRGYRDGWLLAVMAMENKPASVSYREALDVAFGHATQALADWVASSTDSKDWPPDCTINPRARSAKA